MHCKHFGAQGKDINGVEPTARVSQMIHDGSWRHERIARDRVSQLTDPRVLHTVDNKTAHLTLRAVKELPIVKLSLMNGFSLGPHARCSISLNVLS